MAERLRRVIRNHMGFPRRGSNPLGDGTFWFVTGLHGSIRGESTPSRFTKITNTRKGQWSSGMILASGARGREFDSPLAPFCLVRASFSLAVVSSVLDARDQGSILGIHEGVISLAVMIRACQARGPGSTPG